MPTSDGQMVKFPRPLVVRFDALRGAVSRPDFLDALLTAHESDVSGGPRRQAGSAAPVVAQPATPKLRKEPVRKGGVKPSSCPHPVSRRIGVGCGLCGAPHVAK
jgi:hypothetical protein